ncbi:MAG: TldD/PmbA family protein [Clostridia bacterium]|nr:TldD/PmbA family protein [Clostridia bacterium]
MKFSQFLDSKREDCKALIAALSERFQYVSILGSDVKSTAVSVNKRSSNIGEGNLSECGFVIKMHDGKAFFEYSLDDVSGDKAALAEKIIASLGIDESIAGNTVSVPCPADEPMVESFSRESDDGDLSDEEILKFCTEMRDKALASDERLVNCVVGASSFTVSKLFITKQRELDQNYSWVNITSYLILKDGDKMVETYGGSYGHLWSVAMADFPAVIDSLVEKIGKLAKAKPITPGVYDVITDPSISGLIAHEAFGHGVEMDQFVKDRALAKDYVGKYVASPICNMRDGAASALSTASYFFDDDGVLAHDTQIIKDGILVSGISDLVSASVLGTEPTGNGRRESYKRKAYSRMTNTFFEAGTDKLEDMIASVKHGYMLFQTNNGMEDPKNWQIQCTAEYGIEIIDGKLTDNYVSPVVMSGYVPDVLKSISMVSDDFKVIGSGGCGKGYKEWVRVSDGGPALKLRCKLA